MIIESRFLVDTKEKKSEELVVSVSKDEELRALLLQARDGSAEALRLLRLKYRPLLDSSVSRFFTERMTLQEKEDLREEAEQIFITAVSTFDMEQDAVDFGLYAKICLRNGLVTELRNQTARHRLGIVPLEVRELSHEEDPATTVVEAERFQKLYQTIQKNLSDYENRVWWGFVSGVSVKQIAREVGKDERSVHNAIYRIRKKLRELLADQK